MGLVLVNDVNWKSCDWVLLRLAAIHYYYVNKILVKYIKFRQPALSTLLPREQYKKKEQGKEEEEFWKHIFSSPHSHSYLLLVAQDAAAS